VSFSKLSLLKAFGLKRIISYQGAFVAKGGCTHLGMLGLWEMFVVNG
jgi:hypothetical protein